MDRTAGTELAARLRAARSYAKGTTLADIAKATGLSRSTVATWSADEYVPVNRLAHFGEIAELCGLPKAFFTANLADIGDLPTDPRFSAAKEAETSERGASEQGARRVPPGPPAGLRPRKAPEHGTGDR